MSAAEKVTRAELTEALGQAINTAYLNQRLQEHGSEVAWYFDTIDYSVPGRIKIEGATEDAYDHGVTITLAVVSVISDFDVNLIDEVRS